MRTQEGTNEHMSERADLIFTGVPEGLDALVLARLVEEAANGERQGIIVHVVRDDRRLEALEAQLRFFAPKVRVVPFPAWDTVPYDRVGPNPEIVAKRITALSRLALGSRAEPLIVLTTVNAILQRVPPRTFIRNAMKSVSPGQRVDLNRFVMRLSLAGYTRTGTVMEQGEFAVRGGILDLFPPGRQNPVRLDFFGDTLESIKAFDVETQRTAKPLRKLIVMPVSEVAFGEAATAMFRSRYVELFGGATGNDPLYEAVSAGSRYSGQEHWLPLFHDTLETLFDYVGDAAISFDHLVDDAVTSRFEQVSEHYLARTEGLESERFGAPPYKPVPPDQMFLDAKTWPKALVAHKVVRLTPFEMADGPGIRPWRGKGGRSFAAERQNPDANVFDAVVAHVKRVHAEHRRVLVAAWTPGARERLSSLLSDHGLKSQAKVEGYSDALALDPNVTGLAVLGLEQGFETPELVVVAEQDILGDRLVRPRRKAKRAADVLTEATSLSVGDLVVHADHGIGRFHGLKTITALGAPHDCLELKYAGGDTLYLPVENIELLSRYGSDHGGEGQLDKLGGVAWQSRKAKLKKRLREMAAELIKIAALRQLREAPALAPPTGAYDEFVARFPYEETEDQAASIEAVLADLQSGRPMDRLVCGDVGFGKTEVALRAAFVAAMNGLQVAIVVPTTLLARQHSRTVAERFKNLPLNIAQASRLVAAKDLAEVKDGLKKGTVDIVIGTHALLGKQIEFQRLGLLVIDEEQHFGVTHKERLKQLREDVHVLTLSATPIPRTLQLALTGVRELSLITTPPVDRLVVRTYISQFDPVILIDALKRERDRGGQTFYVAPRISDLDEVAEFLREAVPHLKVARAHGQLAPSELEDIMTAFYEGQYDVLLSTAIVESGLDVPNANTLIVHRADMFGLAALYQLRGRVGRSKRRAYAYFTTPPGQALTEGAEKRLKVLQSLDTLGAGFSLASHDLDIRGAGNLLGEEQSGHIREVGFELYQSMLEEAVSAMKGGDFEAADQWSPEIAIGLSVLIPETYVADLQLRLGLYRRLSALETRAEIDAFAAELVDRFGELPAEVDHLLDVMEIKGLCRSAGIAKVDAGTKGAVVTFHRNQFANTQGLAQFLQASRGHAKLQPDHKLVFRGEWDQPQVRFKGVRALVSSLAEIAAKGAKAA
jgi:transcription-repair coupling factor (superfamily II helicase)